MKTVVVREYARLTTDHVESTLDQATVSESAFEWLCGLSSQFNKNGAPLLQLENRRWLKLDSYVGVIETPCGTMVEILPKHTAEDGEEVSARSRTLLTKMLTVALDLPVRETNVAAVETFRNPLLEWVMQQFVFALEKLTQRGLRFDYQRTEDEEYFLLGQLDVVSQMRQPAGRAHLFHIRHDIFTPDRPENRLLRSALVRVCRYTQHHETWRIARELSGLLAEIPQSKDIATDFRRWRDDRLMAHYRPLRPWCELVLGEQMPLALRGKTTGISMLFPMERLFERYVEACMRKQLPAHLSVRTQTTGASLCRHKDQEMFQLRPDFLVMERGTASLLLDAKWKLLNATDEGQKYGLSQSDLYQMFSYGHKYLNGRGEMALIYPKTGQLPSVLPPFHFSPDLTLWVAPFDMENNKINFPSVWDRRYFSSLQELV